MSTVSVLLVNWNDGDRLLHCLRSLDGSGAQVIVVDNASTDGSPRLVAETFPSVTLAPQTANLGFAGGINAGARLASSRYLLLLNTDIVAAPGAVASLASFLDAHAECGAVTGQLLDEEGQP
ncbi:MAG: glycosyltransferase, partial [Planctomycetes bacterium]|nr:glycosyltransferase [Planctomycetota bacterium]